MSWSLFCQIEVILLTVGLVVSFIFSSHQTSKDRSWFKRAEAVCEIIQNSLKTYKESEKEKKNEN